jgi:hypothetical protein
LLALAAAVTPAAPAAPAATTSGAAFNMALVGHNDLGNRGFNADVWVHEQHAYIGSWGFQDWASGSKNRFCPSPEDSGIVVLDAHDPTRPTAVSTEREQQRHAGLGPSRSTRPPAWPTSAT